MFKDSYLMSRRTARRHARQTAKEEAMLESDTFNWCADCGSEFLGEPRYIPADHTHWAICEKCVTENSTPIAFIVNENRDGSLSVTDVR